MNNKNCSEKVQKLQIAIFLVYRHGINIAHIHMPWQQQLCVNIIHLKRCCTPKMTDFLYNYTCLWHLVLIAIFLKHLIVLIVFLSELLKLIGELFYQI